MVPEIGKARKSKGLNRKQSWGRSGSVVPESNRPEKILPYTSDRVTGGRRVRVPQDRTVFHDGPNKSTVERFERRKDAVISGNSRKKKTRQCIGTFGNIISMTFFFFLYTRRTNNSGVTQIEVLSVH